ncbi:hypothetical protein WOSG25_110620 [Weissella oryzae SG25]|uniref:Uncharacterized protein n=1 Tax=Weissella oryzae (strain DSM 25784 / JCM 18191 / LMG 30913 / SG25) TaxID=1329250 RepID=A0A069CVS3_WEIOS|nr:hypothetical protein [Weissella oryzae]GAK31584.1 hypothetical protein WOSG25_110620 [Weissella oryzae SG25]
MFKKHRILAITIILGVIVLGIGGKVGMDYKKDYDWQQEKTRQVAVAKKLKSSYSDISEIKILREGVKLGSGSTLYHSVIIENGKKIKISGIGYYSKDNIDTGGYIPAEGVPSEGKTKATITLILSDGEKVSV